MRRELSFRNSLMAPGAKISKTNKVSPRKFAVETSEDYLLKTLEVFVTSQFAR